MSDRISLLELVNALRIARREKGLAWEAYEEARSGGGAAREAFQLAEERAREAERALMVAIDEERS